MSTTYFKATRPDGTDFRTGTLHHEVGATVFHPATTRFGDMEPNHPGTYLSTSVEPGEVLTGGSWPCALWRVEPIGSTVSRTDGAYPFKRGMRGYRVVEALPAHVALGPNGEQVAALVERARILAMDEAQRLSAARAAARDAAGAAAGDAAWALVVRDLISPEHFDTLYGPWATVVGEATPCD
jgi:hypothetical protein